MENSDIWEPNSSNPHSILVIQYTDVIYWYQEAVELHIWLTQFPSSLTLLLVLLLASLACPDSPNLEQWKIRGKNWMIETNISELSDSIISGQLLEIKHCLIGWQKLYELMRACPICKQHWLEGSWFEAIWTSSCHFALYYTLKEEMR